MAGEALFRDLCFCRGRSLKTILWMVWTVRLVPGSRTPHVGSRGALPAPIAVSGAGRKPARPALRTVEGTTARGLSETWAASALASRQTCFVFGFRALG